MLLAADEMRLLEAACTDITNEAARELKNALGVTGGAADLSAHIASAPAVIRKHLLEQVRAAISYQRGRR